MRLVVYKKHYLPLLVISACSVLYFVEFPRLFSEAPPQWRDFHNELKLFLLDFFYSAGDIYNVWYSTRENLLCDIYFNLATRFL